ncbi:MAG: radical SAM protein [Candidatus Zixiibacteriota bacterium]
MVNLQEGGFVTPAELDELDAIRASHYQARFGHQGFGLTIVPTCRCNFACDYCYESKDIHCMAVDQDSDMSKSVQEHLLYLCEKEIPQNAAFFAMWYGGEPLLSRDVIQSLTTGFVRICESKKSVYHSGMITIGYLLTPDNVEFLAQNQVKFVQITIDGPKHVHDRRRPLRGGGETFDRILDNICYMGEKGKPAVSIRVNIDRRNAEDVPELLSILRGHGLHSKPNIRLYFGQTVHYSNSCPDIASQCMASQEFSFWMVGAYRTALAHGFRIGM